MKVFISWSGKRSKHIAKALQSFLQDVIQRLEPFVSENDIGAGQVWAAKLKEELAESKFTILCGMPLFSVPGVMEGWVGGLGWIVRCAVGVRP